MLTKQLKPSRKNSIIKTESYFPTQFITLGAVGCLGAFSLWMNNYHLQAIYFAIPSLLIAITRKGTTLNPLKNEIRSFLNIGGLVFSGAPIKFGVVKKLHIKKVGVKQNLQSRGSATTIKSFLFKGFMVTDGQTYLLSKSKKREEVVKSMKKVSKEIGVPLQEDLVY